MKIAFSTRLVRSAAVACTAVTLSVGSTGPFIGTVGLAVTAATSAQARCLIGGAIRNDIPDQYCLEAQRTGCVRALLTPDQYRACLNANQKAEKSGRSCIIGGQVRNDLSELDCEEAKATGCVQRLLTPAQYSACLNAQKH
jgi:hypothetical protein